MIRVVELGLTNAIDTIVNEESVYLRRGVWNEYELTETKNAIERIENSGYGADIHFDEKNQKYYVSIPNSSDMW